jgi:hypothetical protein
MLLCVRTTLEIADELLRRAKRKAADEGTTLREAVEAALRRHLASRPGTGAYRLRWRPERGRILPGVGLDDRDALLELMGGRG